MTVTPWPRHVDVATYNVHGGVGSDRRYDPYRTASVLVETGAGIFGLQEVDSRPQHGRDLDQFELFARLTGFHVVAGPNVMLGLHRYGNALLSRWPIQRTTLHDISVGTFERRGIIDVLIDLDGTALRVLTTHLGLRRRERRIQLDRLATILDDGADVPTIIMGDFNLWGWDSAALHRLGHPPTPCPRSWPSWMPLLRLDRLWTRPAHLCRQIRAHRTGLARSASDHLPIVGSIARPHTACPLVRSDVPFAANRKDPHE